MKPVLFIDFLFALIFGHQTQQDIIIQCLKNSGTLAVVVGSALPQPRWFRDLFPIMKQDEQLNQFFTC